MQRIITNNSTVGFRPKNVFTFSLVGLKGCCILQASSHDQNHQSGCVLLSPDQIKHGDPIEASSIANRKGIVFHHENVRPVSLNLLKRHTLNSE